MLKLVSDKGRWAIKNNEMIFSNVVWLTDISEMKRYHLIDENNKEIKEFPNKHYLINT